MFSLKATDIQKASKAQGREAFAEWVAKKMPKPKDLSFEGERQFIKGKDRLFIVASFGDYIDADNAKRRFVSYRCGLGTITIVYSWVWNAERKVWGERIRQQFGSW
jgi:hypothetical protein